MTATFTREQCERIGLDPSRFCPEDPATYAGPSDGGRLYVRTLTERRACSFCGGRAAWLLRVAAGWFRGCSDHSRDRYICRSCAEAFSPAIERAGFEVFRSALTFRQRVRLAVQNGLASYEDRPQPTVDRLIERWSR